jgi:hypothetical protein
LTPFAVNGWAPRAANHRFGSPNPLCPLRTLNRGDSKRLCAEVAYVLNHTGEFVGRSRRQHELGAATCERERDRATDAPAGADDDAAARESATVVPLVRHARASTLRLSGAATSRTASEAQSIVVAAAAT